MAVGCGHWQLYKAMIAAQFCRRRSGVTSFEAFDFALDQN
jgi:hypothetical protein